MIVSLQVVRFNGWRMPFGLLAMPIFHIWALFFYKGFYKFMGTGQNGTFDIKPDLYRWAYMSTWKNQEALEHHMNTSIVYRYLRFFGSKDQYQILMETYQVHGLWDGVVPFEKPATQQSSHLEMIAILTRATIRISKLKAFWQNVPAVASTMTGTPGLKFSLGIGEIPFIKQATISFWQNEMLMKEFAYKKNPHKTVIDKTRAENWYSEELFARFRILKIKGKLF